MQGMATGQPPNAMTRPAGKEFPFALLLPVIEPHLDKGRALIVRGLFAQFRSNKINKDEFLRHMRSLVGDHMLKMAMAFYKVQQEQHTAKLSMDNNAQKQRLLEHQSDLHGVQVSHKSSKVNAIKQKRDQQHIPFPNMKMPSKSYKQQTHGLQMRHGPVQTAFIDMHGVQSRMSSMAYAKHKSQLSAPQGPSSISPGQIESSKAAFSDTAQLERQNVSAGNSSLASGSNAKTPPQKSTVGQIKPLEAPVSSLSKRQKVSGVFSDQSIEQLNDVTAVSGVHLRHSNMEVQDLPLEMRSFPPKIIQTILTLMPLRDAFRTSILSQNWRNHCLNIPKLIFDDAVFRGSTCKAVSVRWKLLYIVYPILLLHQGPILEFSLCISQLISCCEIDQIVLHLSRSSTLKKLTLCIGSGDDHKLLPAFFNLQHLMVLKLQNCAFQPPVTFKGFSRLVCLSFNNVSITAEVFLRFLSNCPQLKDFTLIGDENHLLGCCNLGFVELFECLPLVEHLCMSCYPIKCFATGVIPQKLPTSLVHLKYIRLTGLSFARESDLLSALLLVTSSPKIETIILEMQYNPNEAMSQTAMNLIDQQGYSYAVLDHLCAITITNFTNMKTGMDFVKLILAKSPMLKIVDIMIDKRVDIHGEVKMLKELLQYPRASARAEIRVERP